MKPDGNLAPDSSSGHRVENGAKKEDEDDFGDFGGFEEAPHGEGDTMAPMNATELFDEEEALQSLSFEEKELLRLNAAPLEIVVRDLRNLRARTCRMLTTPPSSEEDNSSHYVLAFREELMESARVASLKEDNRPASKALLLTSPWSVQHVTRAIVNTLPPDALRREPP